MELGGGRREIKLSGKDESDLHNKGLVGGSWRGGRSHREGGKRAGELDAEKRGQIP